MSDLPSGIGASFALADTAVAALKGNPQQAIVNGTGGLFSIAGTEVGIWAGSYAPGALKAPAMAFGAAVGGLTFGSLGMQVGNSERLPNV